MHIYRRRDGWGRKGWGWGVKETGVGGRRGEREWLEGRMIMLQCWGTAQQQLMQIIFIRFLYHYVMESYYYIGEGWVEVEGRTGQGKGGEGESVRGEVKAARVEKGKGEFWKWRSQYLYTCTRTSSCMLPSPNPLHLSPPQPTPRIHPRYIYSPEIHLLFWGKTAPNTHEFAIKRFGFARFCTDI